jgi:O-antigen/teichoic acid export membrane protein
MSQSIITNTTIATGGRVINIVLGIIATALIARLLGPDKFGLYVLILSFGAIVQLSADFGLYLTLTRKIAQQQNMENEIFSQIISLRIVLLVCAFIVGVLITILVPALRQLTVAFIVMFIGLLFQSLSQLFMSLYQYYQVVWRATVGDLLGRLAQILGIVFISFYAANINAVVAVFTASTITAYLIHQRLVPSKSWRFVINWPVWKRVINTSWPLGAMLFVNAIYFRIDTLILSMYQPSHEVGLYGVAYRIIESSLFFPAMLGGLLLPRISEALKSKELYKVGQYIKEGLLVLTVAATYCFIVLQLFNRDIVSLIAGSSFGAASPLLKILSLALVVMFFGNLFGFTLVAMKRQVFLLKLYIGLAVFNLVANFVLIPYYGAQAAAWTTVCTELIAAACAAYQVNKSIKLPVSLSVVVRISAIGVFSVLLTAFLPSSVNFMGRLIFITGLYGFLVYITKILHSTKLPLLRSAKFQRIV